MFNLYEICVTRLFLLFKIQGFMCNNKSASIKDLEDQNAVNFEAKSHWIQAGIEPETFRSQVAGSAI